MLLSLVIFVLSACKKKNGFDVNDPDVDVFVSQLKNSTYNERETDEKGSPLWLKRPRFRQQHIARLIELSKDTSHIEKFPTNPISSIAPFPHGREYFILGECLLSIVEGIRGYGTLGGYLVDTSRNIPEQLTGVTGGEVLMIGNQYQRWWNSYKDGDWKGNNPLDDTPYQWR